MLRRSITPVLYFAATVYFAENVVKHKNIDFRIFFSRTRSWPAGVKCSILQRVESHCVDTCVLCNNNQGPTSS